MDAICRMHVDGNILNRWCVVNVYYIEIIRHRNA